MNFAEASAITNDMLTKSPDGTPIVLCSFDKNIIFKLKEVGYITLNINRLVSEKLIELPVLDRPKMSMNVFQEIITKAKSPVYITDFEMLFDPSYKFDVLKSFCETARIQNIVVQWCGTYDINNLYYSEPQYSDYHSYKISQYTVICVK